MDDRDRIPPDVLRRANEMIDKLKEDWGMRLLYEDHEDGLWSESNDTPDDDGVWHDHFYERLILVDGEQRQERLARIVQCVKETMPELYSYAFKADENVHLTGDLVLSISVRR